MAAHSMCGRKPPWQRRGNTSSKARAIRWSDSQSPIRAAHAAQRSKRPCAPTRGAWPLTPLRCVRGSDKRRAWPADSLVGIGRRVAVVLEVEVEQREGADRGAGRLVAILLGWIDGQRGLQEVDRAIAEDEVGAAAVHAGEGEAGAAGVGGTAGHA